MSKDEQIMFKYLLQIRTEVRELKLASKEVLTLSEAVTYTGYTKSYIYRLVSNGFIPYSKPNGKAIFFERKVLERWLLTKPYSPVNKSQLKAKLIAKSIQIK